MSIAALETFLGPLKEVLEREGVAEVSINRPGEVWIEQRGEMIREEIPDLTVPHLMSLARLVAQSTSQVVNEEKPLLSATLPAGFRIQVVFPPACEVGTVAFSIRKQNIMSLDLDGYEKLGAFEQTSVSKQSDIHNEELKGLLDAHEIKAFLNQAIKYKKNILISGGTSTGKTTFMNAALQSIPHDERLITLEDAREISLDKHPNRVHLLVSKGEQGRAKVTYQELIEACLRLRPDRMIIGELRGKEAFSFLRAVNTGHPGSIATLHADSPDLAIDQLTMMVMQAGIGMDKPEIRRYVMSVIEIIVQLKRGEKGRRFVSEIQFEPN